jgi:hypothetical protein
MPADRLTAQEAYAAMHRNDIAPRLRELGFKGSAGTYVLPDEESWRVVAFQKDRYSTRDWVHFTVNPLVSEDGGTCHCGQRQHRGTFARSQPPPSTTPSQHREGRVSPYAHSRTLSEAPGVPKTGMLADHNLADCVAGPRDAAS